MIKSLGFIAIENTFPYSADIHIFGVHPEHHNKGIGSKLLAEVERYLKALSCKFLTVKTLGLSSDYQPYAKTRKFYEKRGFLPIIEFNDYWDKKNPCLIMLKELN